MDLEKRIDALERKAEKLGLAGGTPGTEITRVLADSAMLRARGLKGVSDGLLREIAWCVGVGGLGQPKQFYFGWTISEAVRSTERGLAAIAKAAKAGRR